MPYNTVTLYGKQTCDYLYIQNDEPSSSDFSYVNDEPTEWRATTTLYANFNDADNRLAAGDSALIGNIDGYEIYRRKYDEANIEYVGTVHSGEENVNDLIVDYSVRNGVDYTYYLFPTVETSGSGTPLAPLITKQLSIDVPYWSLFIVDDTDEENIFYLDKLFKFELNLDVQDMSNNTQATISQNFTRYPTIQYGSSNYWSGSLGALCGFMSTNGVNYIQNVNMIEELKTIALDTRRKFLKDMAGNLWEVNVSAPISMSTEYMCSRRERGVLTTDIKTWNFPWVEVGDASGVSIINNPTKKATDWVLTEKGEAIPYYTYQWGEQYEWNNSYLWTAHTNISNEDANMGRSITE